MLSLSSATVHSPRTVWLLPGIVLLSLAIFLLDYLTPAAYSAWLLYLIPLMLTVRMPERRFPPIVAAVCTVLVVLGFFLPLPAIDQPAVIFGRVVGVSMLWFTVVLLLQRMRVEEALRASEARLNEAQHNASIGSWSYVPGGPLIISDEMYELYKLPRDVPITYEVVVSAVHPEDRARNDGRFKKALESGALDFQDDYRLVWPDGQVRDISALGKIRRAADGRVIEAVGTVQDVTERRQAEKALQATEERVRLFIEHAPASLAMFDREMRYLSVSRRWMSDYGFGERDLRGLSHYDVFPEIDEHWKAIHRRALDGEVVRSDSDRLDRLDGSVQWLRWEVRPWHDAAGDVGGIVVFSEDISERKRAEAALLESEEGLGLALDAARMGTFDRDVPTNRTTRSRWHEALWGFAHGESDGSVESYSQRVHPDDLPGIDAEVARGKATGEPWAREFRVVWPDGSVHWIGSTGQFTFDDADQPVRMRGVVMDITERKQAEGEVRRLHEELQRYAAELEQRVLDRTAQLEDANTELRHGRAELESLFESLPGLYLVLTPDLKIVAASDAYLQATLTTRDGILGHALFEVFPDNPDDPETTAVSNLRASIDRVIRNAAPDTMAIQKHDVRGPDGVFVERYWSSMNAPMFGSARQIKYIVHRVEEVTEFVRQRSRGASDTAEFRIRLEQMEAEVFQSSQKVQAANQQLEAANKELEAFSYSVSHDLRSPLRAINGFARMLTEDHGDKLDAEGRRLLEVVRSEALRMGQLIDELLQFSRLGPKALQKSAIDMTPLAREVYNELRTRSPERTVDFRLDSLPLAAADPALLRQVWINLLDNALKFSRHRERAEIVVTGSIQAGEATYSVRDNGAGFDMRYSEKLFGVFQRLHGLEEFEGTGVGLALVQRIVHRHGGRVWAEGAPDRGATFSFSLPVSETSVAGAFAGKPGGAATLDKVVKRTDR
jgi:PAS domain S-box-containing protein